jgi:hypothetical protein
MAGMRALGRLFDIGTGFVPVDLNTAGATGKRVSLTHATGATFVFNMAVAGAGTDSNVITFKQHTAYTSGTSNDLAAATVTTSSGITAYWIKGTISRSRAVLPASTTCCAPAWRTRRGGLTYGRSRRSDRVP